MYVLSRNLPYISINYYYGALRTRLCCLGFAFGAQLALLLLGGRSGETGSVAEGLLQREFRRQNRCPVPIMQFLFLVPVLSQTPTCLPQQYTCSLPFYVLAAHATCSIVHRVLPHTQDARITRISSSARFCAEKKLSEHALLLNGPNQPLSVKTPAKVACSLDTKPFTGVRARSGFSVGRGAVLGCFFAAGPRVPTSQPRRPMTAKSWLQGRLKKLCESFGS